MATRTLSATQMAIIIERIVQAQAALRPATGCYSTCLDLPLDWLMEATCSDVAVEQTEAV